MRSPEQDHLQARGLRQLWLSDIERREDSEFQLKRASDMHDVQGTAADRPSVFAAQLGRSFPRSSPQNVALLTALTPNGLRDLLRATRAHPALDERTDHSQRTP